jgi:hypothetical protein
MMDPRAGYRAKNAEHRNQATPAQARAKATASLDGHKDYIRRNMVELGRSAGVPDYTLNNLVGASEFLPGVGDALDVQDAGSMIGEAFKDPTLGKIGGAGIMALAASLGVLPVGGDVASTVLGKTAKNVAGEAAERAVRPGIRAYHGSPHNFDKFDLKHVGTGEGAQGEGYGLYFGEHPNVADYYRDSVSGNAPDLNDMVKIGGGGEVASEFSLDMINDMGLEPPYPKDAKFYDAWRDKAQEYARMAEDYGDYSVSERSLKDAVDDAESNVMAGAGTRYEVNINSTPDAFLTEGAELTNLAPEIQKRLKERGITTSADMWKATFTPDGARILSDAGIPGVRYLDQGSRAAGEGSSNYVVFDDDLIEILKKYGLSGVLAGGGAAGLYSLLESRGEGPVDGGT